jgi:hypothetical protein
VTPQETYADINTIIRKTIEAGLSDEQRYPAIKKIGRRDYDIYIQDAPNLSSSMKGHPYIKIYNDLSKSGAYNLKMIDGALIQMLFTFRKGEVASHRLSVFPSPNLDIYEDAQQAYEEDEVFADIIERHVIRFPIRFDFSNDDKLHVDMKHPKSHLTLGEYTYCRIPVSSPLTPTKFMNFVLRSFYSPAIERFNFSAEAMKAAFPETITANERIIGHFGF